MSSILSHWITSMDLIKISIQSGFGTEISKLFKFSWYSTKFQAVWQSEMYLMFTQVSL